MHENRETSSVFPASGDRSGKAQSRTPDVYAGEESDRAVVPMKPPNKEAQASAEVVEGRARTKENTSQSHTPPAQYGHGVSQGLAGVRKAARERKQERFTTLLHHLTTDLLRESYYALKRWLAHSASCAACSHSYQWDAEGHVISVDSGNTASMTYNALGARVYRTNGARSYSVDPQGQFLGAYRTAGGTNYWNAVVPFGGRTLAQYGSGSPASVYFDHPNALGSGQQWTNWAGGSVGEMLFYPYGQMWGDTTGGTVFRFYASLLWYDPEVDGYQPPNRYLVPRLSRWMSPDPLGQDAADPSDPQTWNMYAYVRNNPTALTDPTGLWPPWYHHVIIEDVFGPRGFNLGAHAVLELENASDWVDDPWTGNQADSRAFVHAMRNGPSGQSAGEAERESLDYIESELQGAVAAQVLWESGGGKGFSDAALVRFGHALHTATDATSPEHAGYQPWCVECIGTVWSHHRREERSATSSNLADEEARYQAHVAAAALWARFQEQLEKKQKVSRSGQKVGE